MKIRRNCGRFFPEIHKTRSSNRNPWITEIHRIFAEIPQKTVSYGQSNIQTHKDTGFFRVNGLRTFGPPSFSHHSVRQTFQYFLQRSSYLCFLCYAKNSLFCFRPFPEVTLLARRRRRGAVMSSKKRKKKKNVFFIFFAFP